MKTQNINYHLDSKNKEFVIGNYNFAKPFSNFLPGIAGLFGIPMWVFYVNRGQGIISCGTEDKDHAILEFHPANKAYQLCSTQGFRTFIKIKKGKEYIFYEPFQVNHFNAGFNTKQELFISSAQLRLEETNHKLGLKITVEYFTIPNASFAGLARKLTIENLGSSKKELEIIDGVPVIVPYGTGQWFLKEMSRTVEAWMQVENLDRNAPFYRLKVDPADKPEVVFIEKGNFYLNYCINRGKPEINPVIVDPDVIFNGIADFCEPKNFFVNKPFKIPDWQMKCSKTPSAFGFVNLKLSAHSSDCVYTILGKANNLDSFNALLPEITKPNYLEDKQKENIVIIEQIQNNVFIASASEELNLYAQQTYLDNVLRGGLPIVLGEKDNPVVFHVYSRKHGDLERDYNRFLISASYLPQGNGSYRDICQNRRLDVWSNSEVKDSTLMEFFNLIQADGYNPLVIEEDVFYADKLSESDLKNIVKPQDARKLLEYLAKPFKLGRLLVFLEEEKIHLKLNRQDFLKFILSISFRDKEAQHGEGFWSDHWAYNLDNLENYLAVYPDSLQKILLERKDFTFFDNTHMVRPRSERYVLYRDKLPRQLHSVYSSHAKFDTIKNRSYLPNLARDKNGQIYKTTLIVKMLCVIVNKLASLDPFGLGIEMEADKPNWFDALNGLPGLFGSSICETVELERWIRFILSSLEELNLKNIGIKLPAEIYDFVSRLSVLLEENSASQAKDRDFAYWDKSNAIKEGYREKVKLGFGGAEKELSVKQLKIILMAAEKKISRSLTKAYDKKEGLLCSYFINEVVKYEFISENNKKKLDNEGRPFIKSLEFKQIKLPLFLEGPMHALRIQDNIAESRKIYQAVRKSRLFDKKLKMYKVTEPLASAPLDIGRCRVFTPGWLENESVWLHMEYKYLLELLKKGLYEEFYQDFYNCVIAFQDPARYGRSILENSSFLASSAFADEKFQGNGFVARLSGSTIEFLNILLLIGAGRKPFYLDKNGKLNLKFSPVLDKSLFTVLEKNYTYYTRDGKGVSIILPKGVYAFNFLKDTLVVYHNPHKKHTFGVNKARISSIRLEAYNKKVIELKQDVIAHPLAGQVRSGEFRRIDIFLE